MISDIKEVFDKINKDRFVVGLDINDSFAQVSVCKVDSDNPYTLSVKENSDEFNVPLYMLKRRDDGAWLFGQEAYDASDEGVLINNLFERARLGKTVRIDREEYLAKDVFLLFLKKVLLLFPTMVTPDKILSITITLKDANSDTILMLQELPSMIKVNPDILHFVTYEESYYYYMLYQPEELQNHNILLFDTSGEKLRSYSLMRNFFKTPGVATVDVKEYVNFSSESPTEYEKGERDALFMRISSELCNSTVYSGVYLIGQCFYSDWASESLQYLCKGRKVFKGNNLFSKGACYAAKEKLNPSGKENKIQYLGDDRLKVSIGVETDDKPKQQIVLIESGAQWFEAFGRTELILKETDKINIFLAYVNNNYVAHGEITLPGLNTSSNRITRISIEVKMTGENKVHFKVWDMGFGELFPSTGKDWEQELSLEG
ncbi:MAG: hypothetical protein J5840_08045 [Lachnospiraceae bacterium]|nr:hypothetical protein [Lachnospiraceae bacterium]